MGLVPAQWCCSLDVAFLEHQDGTDPCLSNQMEHSGEGSGYRVSAGRASKRKSMANGRGKRMILEASQGVFQVLKPYIRQEESVRYWVPKSPRDSQIRWSSRAVIFQHNTQSLTQPTALPHRFKVKYTTAGSGFLLMICTAPFWFGTAIFFCTSVHIT